MIAWVKANRYWLIACGVSVLAAYGTGRFASPTRVETRDVERVVTKVEYRDRVVKVQGPVRIVTKTLTVPGPAGPTVTVERVVTRDPVTTTIDTTGTGSQATEKIVEKIVERDAPRLTLLGTIGTDITNPKPVYGGFVAARIAGPLTVGAGFDSSLRATVAAGLAF
jgi:hypothetical protein